MLKKIAILSILIASTTFADDNGSAGRVVVKGKIIGVNPAVKSSVTDTSTQFFPLYTNNQYYPVKANTTAGNVLGVAASATYFLSDHLALEASTGFISQKIKVTGSGPQFNALNGQVNAGGSFAQSTKAGFIPFAAAVQYHIAPYGKVSPYIGAGYHYSFASASSGSAVGNSKGPLFQVGVDGWINRNVMFNLEIKKMYMNPMVNFRNNWSVSSVDTTTTPNTIVGSSQNLPTSTKIKLNPLIISAGIGIRL